MNPRHIKTSDGHTYLHKAHNWPTDFDDRMKDEVLKRLGRSYNKLRTIALQGLKDNDGELGTMMVSLAGLLSPAMMAGYLPKSKCTGPMSFIATTIEEGEFHPANKMHITLFYDTTSPEPFHPSSQVGIFYIGEDGKGMSK